MPRAFLAALGLVALATGCEREAVFTLSDTRTCAADVLAVDDGLLSHLVASEDGGRSFDHVPDSPLIDRVVGTYDLVTGVFGWSTTYADGYRVLRDDVAGTGTAYVDGDLDLDYTITTQLRGNKRTVNRVRELRLGCDVQRVTYNRNDELVATEVGTVQADGYHYVRTRTERGVLVDTEGVLAGDRTRTEAEAWRSGRYQYAHTRTDDGLGKVTTDFEEVDDGVQSAGTVVDRFDGSSRHQFTATDSGATLTWDYVVEASGNGEGTLEVSPPNGNSYECDVVFEDFACFVECPGLGSAPC